jgi:hypothetical protein
VEEDGITKVEIRACVLFVDRRVPQRDVLGGFVECFVLGAYVLHGAIRLFDGVGNHVIDH